MLEHDRERVRPDFSSLVLMSILGFYLAIRESRQLAPLAAAKVSLIWLLSAPMVMSRCSRRRALSGVRYPALISHGGGLLDRVRALDHHRVGTAVAHCSADRVR